MKPRKLSDEQVQNSLTQAVTEAVAFIEERIAPDRIRATRYYSGKVNLSHEEGRSRVVATKCRDAVRAVKPALMRVFLQSGDPVEFVGRTPQGQQAAKQATSYAKYVFERNNGFSVLSDVFDDALVKKVGIAKVYFDETETVEVDEYTGLTQAQVDALVAYDGVEILEQRETIGPMGMLYDVTASRTDVDGEIRVQSVAPEDFFIDEMATSIEDAYVCGHSTYGRVSDLVAMGFDFDEVYELSGVSRSGSASEEEYERNQTEEDEDNGADPSMRKVLITEAYMRMDIEGTGVARPYKFICAGSKYTILDKEPCDYFPFAAFEVDPQPHTFFGWSLVDIIVDDQDASTSMLRGMLDAINMANNPRVEAVEGMVNMDDLLNNEIGGIIRVKGPGGIREIVTGQAVAGATLPAMQYYDEAIRAKTGITGAGMGMDADALQSQTAAGVNAAVQAASAVSELIARTLAEGGMKQLFKLISQLARQHPKPDEVIRVDGQYTPVDPTSWGTDMDMIANVGLGNNQRHERLAMVGQALQFQMQILGAYGPTNGLVGLTNIRNAMADMLKLSGVNDADRYLQPMTPEIEMQMQQQAAQAAAQAQQGAQSDPNAAFLQAEAMKAQLKAQTDMARTQIDAQKAQADYTLRVAEMERQDDLARDKMAQDLYLDAAKIAADGITRVNIGAIQNQQNRPRE